MALPRDLIVAQPGLDQWAHIVAWRGSHSHGTYVPPTDPDSIDDKDILSVVVPPLDYYYGLQEYGSRGTKEYWHNEWDIVEYEARKFVHLLYKGNPNVLGILWLEENHYLKRTEAGRWLITQRDAFVGKHVYHSFSGYAHSQLHKMYAFSERGYMGAKRKALVTKHGYDTKNAAHLIRLLRMGIEFLNDGKMTVLRPDASELIDIKKGKWSLDEVHREADSLFTAAREAHIHSKLPTEPDRELVSAICKGFVARALEETR